MSSMSSSSLTAFLQEFVDNPSVRQLKRFSRLFYSVCHATDELGEDDSTTHSKVLLDTPDDHQSVILFALVHLRTIFDTILEISELQSDCPSSSPKWSTVEGSVKVIISGLMHFIASLQNLGNSSLINYVLIGSSTLAPYLAVFPSLTKIAISASLRLWTQEPDDLPEITLDSEEVDEEKEKTGVSLPAFQFLSSVMQTMALRDGEDNITNGVKILKKAVEEFLAVAKFTSESSFSFHSFLLDSLTSLFASSPDRLSYPAYFFTLREAARTARGAVITRKGKGKKSFYSKGKRLSQADLKQKALSATQFARLRFLVSTMLKMHNNPEFKLLLQPLYTVLTGTATMASSPASSPSKLIAIEMMINLIEKTGVFCPMTGLFTGLLTCSAFVGKLPQVPKKAVFLNISVTLKASEGIVGSRLLAQPVLKKSADLLRRLGKYYRGHPSFPELFGVILNNCKHSLETCDPSLSTILKDLITELSLNSEFIRSERAAISFSVTESNELSKWMKQKSTECPLGRIMSVKTLKKATLKTRKSSEVNEKEPRIEEEVEVNNDKVKVEQESLVELVMSDEEEAYESDTD
ncbi:hypothetical protein GEMRC1_013653 [Eukaryota sp. GEM-RC1]